MTRVWLCMVLAGSVFVVSAAGAQTTDAERCAAGKMTAAGKYALCRLKAEAKAEKRMEAPDYSKCDEKQLTAWTKIEDRYGTAACPSSSDQTTVRDDVTDFAACLTSNLLGTPADCNLSTCQSDLATCQARPLTRLLGTGQTLCSNGSYNAFEECATGGSPGGQDGDFQAGLSRSYTDNGDGTVTDNRTGLMWEKLSDNGNIHDKDNTYSWDRAFTDKAATLNQQRFAGYNDWRVPNRFELESILDFRRTNDGIQVDPVFHSNCNGGCGGINCSCTSIGIYWTSTSVSPTSAWAVAAFGAVDERLKVACVPCGIPAATARVRVVRGGL